MRDFMEDLMDNPQDQYDSAITRITELRKLQRTTPPGEVLKSINGELQQLEQQKEMLEQFYSFSEPIAPDMEIAGEETPWLQRIRETFTDVWDIKSNDNDHQGFLFYLFYFEHHLVPVFSRRYLKLDLKHSYERDSFYDLFLQISRELEVIEDEIKTFEKLQLKGMERSQGLQRIRKLKNEIYIKFNEQLQNIYSFVSLILDDIYTGGNICLNHQQILESQDFDQVTELSGLTVQEALENLASFSKEVMLYLNIPEF